MTVLYTGKSVFNGEQCFKVKFTNGYELMIIPQGLNLKVVDSEGQYNKLFKWHYEGPINGIGTFCEPCAEDENESILLINEYFMR